MASKVTTYRGFKIVLLQPDTLAAYRNEEYERHNTASYKVTVEADNYSEQLKRLMNTIDDMNDDGEFEGEEGVERGVGAAVGTVLDILSGIFR